MTPAERLGMPQGGMDISPRCTTPASRAKEIMKYCFNVPKPRHEACHIYKKLNSVGNNRQNR